jgi:hypothetical protein
MIVALAVAVLSLSFALDAQAKQTASTKPSISEQEALATAVKWADQVCKPDTAGLGMLLNEKYMHIHGTGLVETKAQFVDALSSGTRKYDPMVFEDTTVRSFGDCAVVTGKFPLSVLARGKKLEGVNRFSMVLVKDKTGIHVVSFQATAIPQQ